METSTRRGVVAALSGLTVLAAILPGGAAHAAPTSQIATSVQIGYTDAAAPGVAFDAANGVNLPLGSSVDASGRRHTSRIYATYDLTPFLRGEVSAATIHAREFTAADCTKRAIEVWQTESIRKTPKWRTAPRELRKLAEDLTATPSCPRNLSFDVAAAVRDAVDRGDKRITFALRVPAAVEADPAYGRTLNWYDSVQLSVRYNHAPKIEPNRLYNGGFECRTHRPVPVSPNWAGHLEALASDVDESDSGSLRLDFAVWPVDDPAARVEVSQSHYPAGRVARVNVPAERFTDGRVYAWQVRAYDGVAYSAWSKTCLLAVDGAAPPPPAVTSSNYPAFPARAPVGEPGRFRFDAGGNRDIAGFEYAFESLSVPGCDYGGDVGQLVCRELFTGEGEVAANRPGGTADVLINPERRFINRLLVRSVDRAGNRSDPVEYQINAPGSPPTVSLDGPRPQWGDTVTVVVTPATGVTGVSTYEYRLNGGETKTVAARPDGLGLVSFVADNEFGTQLEVRSRSANGFVSTWASWSLNFDPWPGVSSDVYLDNGAPAGGVGVPGTFTFTRPPGTAWLQPQGYQYWIDDVEQPFVAAGADGRASVTYTPTASGDHTLMVYAVDAAGNLSNYANFYSFQVA